MEPASLNREWQYDEFCLVCNFLTKPLQSVQLIPFNGIESTVDAVEKRVRRRKGGDAAEENL